jgi:hypothetical protein
MWENYYYEGGNPNDSGILGTYDSTRIGAAVCWEFMRTMTARRLRHKVDASGKVLAHRSAAQGEGIICAEISLGAQATTEEIPNRYWLRSRGFLPAFAWHHQRWLGRRWYARNVLQ